MVLACSLLGSKRSSGSPGREGLRGGVLLVPHRVGALIIKTRFLQHNVFSHAEGQQAAEAQFAWLQGYYISFLFYFVLLCKTSKY